MLKVYNGGSNKKSAVKIIASCEVSNSVNADSFLAKLTYTDPKQWLVLLKNVCSFCQSSSCPQILYFYLSKKVSCIFCGLHCLFLRRSHAAARSHVITDAWHTEHTNEIIIFQNLNNYCGSYRDIFNKMRNCNYIIIQQHWSLIK
jgi:hypothetical protein